MRSVLVLALATATTAPAQGQSSAPPEVKARFQRAVQQFNSGDLRGAVVEFEKVRAAYPRPVVSYNLGLIYAALGEPARAVALLDEMLAAPGNLTAAHVARAQEARARQAALLGELSILVPIEGAEVAVAGSKVGRAPLPSPVPVKAGSVLVGASAPRHQPVFDEVAVKPGERAEVRLDLVPIDKPLGQLKVVSATPAAELVIDGRLVARAPFLSTLPVEPGSHLLELRREGYRPVSERLELTEGTLTWERSLEEDEATLAQDAASVSVAAGEGAVELVVDGRRRGLLTNPVRVVPGPHVLEFRRGGFHPEVRELDVRALQEIHLELAFTPTPELRAELEAGRSRHRQLGFGGLALGGAMLVGSAAYLAYNVDQSAKLDALHDELLAGINDKTGTSECSLPESNCEAQLRVVDERRQQAATYRAIGIAGIGLGAAIAVAGASFLFTAPDPTRYDRPGSGLLLESLALGASPGGGFVALGGRF